MSGYIPFFNSNIPLSSSESESRAIIHDSASYTITAVNSTRGNHIKIQQKTISRYINHIEIPASICQSFVEKLIAIKDFIASYVPKNVSEQAIKSRSNVFPLSQSLITPRGRKYYFDVFDGQNAANLIVSYVAGENRKEKIFIYADLLPQFISIINELSERIPNSITSEEPLIEDRRNIKRRVHQSNNRLSNENRKKNNSNTIDLSILLKALESDTSKSDLKEILSKSVKGKRQMQPLKVLDDPKPITIEGSLKTYRMEVVIGENHFLRISENMNGSRRGALHIPFDMINHVFEGLQDFICLIGEYQNSLDSLSEGQ